MLPYTLWAEWLSCVPLMTFIAVVRNEDETMTLEDFHIIFSITVCIYFGFFMTVSTSLVAYSLFFALSMFAYCYAYFKVYVPRKSKVQNSDSEIEISRGSDRVKLFEELLYSNRKQKMDSFMLFVLPPFPLIYILTVAGTN